MKRLALFTVAALLASSIIGCTAAPTVAPIAVPTQPTATAPVVLKLEGTSDAKSLTMNDLKALPAAEGWAGIKSSTGKITIPERFKGVAIDELCKLVGGLSAETGVNVVAKDGYAMTISYDQIAKGDFITYDPGTGDELKSKDPLQVIIAYEKEGKPLPEDSEGTLRLVVVSAKNNQVVDGHWSVKWVVQVGVKSLAQDWKLQLTGVIKEEMDRGTFQSCSAPSCHGAKWTDDKAQVLSGVPLWMLAARVDDETKHGDNAFNQKLAEQGYKIEIVAADGYKVTLDSARVTRSKDYVIAYLVNNNPLDDNNFPLRLVGVGPQKNEAVGKIAKINLILSAQSAAASEPTKPPTPKPAETKPAAATTTGTGAKAALTITGVVEKELALTLDALKSVGVVKISAEHPKQGMQTYEGVRLNAVLDQAKVKSGASKLILTSSDGYTVEVGLYDVGKCADCLIAFADGGKLNAAMPGMQSSFWAKDLVKIEVK